MKHMALRHETSNLKDLIPIHNKSHEKHDLLVGRIGEFIRSTWWTSDVVHYSTKKLPHI